MKTSWRILIISSTLLLSLILAPVTTVYAITVPAEINKSFNPIAIVSGGTSTLRVTVYNLNQNPLTSANWTDNLPAGITIENPPNLVNTCGGTVTEAGGGSLDPGDTTFQLNNGTVPAQNPNGTPGECYVEVDVTSTTPGNLINTIPAGALSSETIDPDFPSGPPVPITNTSPASATLNVIGVQPPSLSKSFAPNTIFVGATSTLTITVRNNDSSFPLTELTLTDTLPTGGNGDVVVAISPNISLSGCGPGTLEDGGGGAVSNGDTEIVLVDATIAPSSNCVVSVDVTSLVQGAYTNTIPAGPGGPGSIQTREGVTNGSPASAPLNVQAFDLTKSFATDPIAPGETSQVTITIQNNATIDYTGADLDDVLPAGFEYVDGTQSTTCNTSAPPETVTIETSTNPNDTVRLSGGTIPASSSCTITADARALMDTAEGSYTNTIPQGTLSTNEGATNHAPAADDIDVVSLSINKAFLPDTFAAGQTTTLTITLNNPSPNPFTVASPGLLDQLPTTPNSNLRFILGSAVTTCGGGSADFAEAVAPFRTLRLSGGAIPAGTIASPGTCTVTAQVTTDPDVPANNYNNTIAAGDLTTVEGGTNASPASDGVSVTQISVNKTFTPSTVAFPNASLLRITITNPATGGALTGVTVIDNLPAGIEVAPYIGGSPPGPSPAPSTTCTGGTIDDGSGGSLDPGDTTIRLTGGTLPAGPSNCLIDVYVRPAQSTPSGTYTNTLGPGSVTTNEGPTNSNTGNRILTVNAVSLSKAFQYSAFQAGDTNILTITLTNATGSPLTVNSVSDTLPTSPNSNLEFVVGSEGTTCAGGTASLSGGPPPRTVTLTGGTIPASGSCTLTATITTAPGVPDASYTNTIPINGLTTVEGPYNTSPATAPVDVYTITEGVTVTKGFSPSTIDIGNTSTLALTFTAPADTDLTNFTFSDTLPTAGDGDVTVSSFISDSGCGTLSGASWPPSSGDTTISASGGTILAGATCIVEVAVTSDNGSGPGNVYTNTITPGDVSNNENRNPPGDVSADLTVQTPSTLDISKVFFPDYVNPEGLSTLTIILENSNPAGLINVTLTDTLPGTAANGVVVAPVPNASTTCGGTLDDGPAGNGILEGGDKVIRLTGGTIPAQVGGINGICTINVDVQGKSTNGAVPVTHTNTIPPTDVVAQIQDSPSTMNSQGAATDDIIVGNLNLEIVKGFNPQLVFGGASSEMSIILRNPNIGAELVNISFTDNMPAGEMILFAPPNFDASDCDPPSGPPAVLSGVAGASTFTFSGGYLAPGDECTLTLDATLVVNGNRTNTIPAGAVTTFNGATNGTPTSATLTNLAGASLSKDFAPNPIASGLASHSILSITIRTTATVAITGMGYVDNLPAGLQVAGGAAPAPTNTCGGTLTAVPGTSVIQLVGGSLLIGFDQCIMTIPVTGANPGVYTNTIPSNTLVTDQGVTNIFPTSDTLTLTPYSLGNRVWFDTNNNGLRDGGEVGVQGVRVELYRDDGITPGVFDAGDTYLSFNDTDTNGYYRFDDLGAGDYVVIIPADNFRDVGAGDTNPADPLAGYLSSGTSIAANGTTSDGIGSNPDDDVDDDDNGMTSFTSNAVDFVSAQAVTLGPGGSEPTGETNPTTNPQTGEAVDNQSNRTVDFGFYRQELGNLVFQDIDEDGAFGGSDGTLDGATVQLFAADGTTEINVGPDGIWGTSDDAPGGMTSVGGGNYRFSGLPAGIYRVKVMPTGYPGTVDTANPGDTANPNNNVDDNDNGVGTGAGITSSNSVTLIPGNPGALGNNVVTAATGTTYNPTVDFGFVTFFAKTIVSTDATHTQDPSVTIGEIITYEVDMVVLPGALNAVQLVDTPQAGLAFVDCLTINLPSNVASSTYGAGGNPIACDTFDGTTPGVSNPLIENNGGRISYDFGTITNATGANQVITVQYTLIVLDIVGNQDGDTLTNDVTWTYQGGSRTTQAPLVDIVEPQLEISKSASPTTVAVGGTVTFTIDLNHAGISTADAFDVVIRDQIPAGLSFLPASLVIGGSATVNPPPYFDPGTNTLTIAWDVIRLTETASVTFDATYLGPPPVVNSASAEWTSLEIDPALPGPPPVPVQLSPYNPSATERYYDPAAPAGVNNYVASDSVTINAGAIAPVSPETGFVTGKVTVLPEQPLDYRYSDLGDLWLEIPSLGVEATIIGVPKSGNSWDVTWLWDQVGYLDGTAFPGWDGNSVLTSHVYLPNGLPGPFVNLKQLRWGDRVMIDSFGTRYIYEVRDSKLMKPSDQSILRHEEQPWLTLVTCQGYDEETDTYRWRRVVRAVLMSTNDSP
jgi:LPXTG-site transpeptidase (sortase) family protein